MPWTGARVELRLTYQMVSTNVRPARAKVIDPTSSTTPEMAAAGRDFDSFDDFCDQLLVFDAERGNGPDAVVGTYRVMRREGAARRGQFYTSDEYQIDCLTAYPGEILDLGRSCVDVEHRGGIALFHLWSALADYASRRRRFGGR